MDDFTLSFNHLSLRPEPRRFFELPGEIRNHIYAHIANNFRREVNVAKDRVPRETQVAYTNKQANAELVPILVSKTRFVIRSASDVAYLSRFLDHSGTRECVRSVAFPEISRAVQYPLTSPLNQSTFFQSCNNLKDLNITLHSDGIEPYASLELSWDRNIPRPRRSGVSDTERVSRMWGLHKFPNMLKLEKLKLECEIKKGHGHLRDAFKDIASWVDLHLRGVPVELEQGGTEDREVTKRSVEFTGNNGLCDLIVFMFTIRRNVRLEEAS